MRAVVESIGRVGSRVTVGGHQLVFDQPRSVAGGEDRGPSPLDVTVASVAACAHYFAAAYLDARGIATDGLTVEVEADKVRDPAARIGRLSLTLRVPVALSDVQLAAIERAIKSCPAYGTLLRPPQVDIAVERAAEVATMGA